MKYGREIWSWALYDFANCPYATTVLAVVFSTYFVHEVVPASGLHLLGWTLQGDAVWALMNSLAMILVALSAPALGALADQGGYRKRFLAIFWLLGVSTTALLALPPRLAWIAPLFVLSAYAYSAANIFYSSFLPMITDRESMGRVSGLGWGLGYLAGGICLAVNMLMLKYPERFGLTVAGRWDVRATFLIVSVWWVIFALPLFAWLRPDVPGRRADVASSYGELWRNLKLILRYHDLCKFLIAFLLYNDAIATLIVMASPFAAELLHMTVGDIVLCFLMIQGVALVGSFVFGWVADRIGKKRAIVYSLFIWSGILLWACFLTSSGEFWILGALVGLVLGGTQATSRAFMGEMTPPAHTSAFFGFYGLSGKVAAITGTSLYGLTRILTGSVRWAVFSLLVLLLVGLFVLTRVSETQGVARAKEDVSPVA